MDIQTLLNGLKSVNQHSITITKYTLIVNEKSETQGALFFIPLNTKEYKVLVPAPFHLDLLHDSKKPNHIDILQHREALLLK